MNETRLMRRPKLLGTLGFYIGAVVLAIGAAWSTAATPSNTEVILMHSNVRGMMASGDIRGNYINYIMTRATWTTFGTSLCRNSWGRHQSVAQHEGDVPVKCVELLQFATKVLRAG